MIRALKTIVHVESRSRNVRVRKTSATPASPPLVALSMASTYFDLGAASCICLSRCSPSPKCSADFDLRCTFHNLVHCAGCGPQKLPIESNVVAMVFAQCCRWVVPTRWTSNKEIVQEFSERCFRCQKCMSCATSEACRMRLQVLVAGVYTEVRGSSERVRTN
jgi:hypothetical protein